MKLKLDINIEFLKLDTDDFAPTENIAKEIINKIDYSKCITIHYNKATMPSTFNEIKFEDSFKNYPGNMKESRKQIDAFKEIPTDYNIYFLIHATKDIIYYVGKKSGNDIRTRLKEHLCKKSETTKSRIIDVHGIVSNMEEPSIRVYALIVKPSGLYSAVEGLLVDYLTKDYEHEKHVWNERLD